MIVYYSIKVWSYQVLKKLFTKKEPTEDYKTISFYKFAQSIGAVDSKSIENIDIDELLLKSFLFFQGLEIFNIITGIPNLLK